VIAACGPRDHHQKCCTEGITDQVLSGTQSVPTDRPRPPQPQPTCIQGCSLLAPPPHPMEGERGQPSPHTHHPASSAHLSALTSAGPLRSLPILRCSLDTCGPWPCPSGASAGEQAGISPDTSREDPSMMWGPPHLVWGSYPGPQETGRVDLGKQLPRRWTSPLWAGPSEFSTPGTRGLLEGSCRKEERGQDQGLVPHTALHLIPLTRLTRDNFSCSGAFPAAFSASFRSVRVTPWQGERIFRGQGLASVQTPTRLPQRSRPQLSSLRPRGPGPSSPPSHPGVQAPALLPQTRSPAQPTPPPTPVWTSETGA
jgi:hypothetical protein